MSDTSKRVELGAGTFFQLGTETVIPDDGNAYAMIRRPWCNKGIGYNA